MNYRYKYIYFKIQFFLREIMLFMAASIFAIGKYYDSFEYKYKI